MTIAAIKRYTALISACWLLLGCAGRHAEAAIAQSQHHTVDLSGIKLAFTSPSLLRPSKDFPSPYVADHIDLSQLSSPKSIFSGYWDGPRYQFISVTGTLQISLAVEPWPKGANTYNRCSLKVRSIAEKGLSSRQKNYRDGYIPLPPEMFFEPIALAGQNAYHYWYSTDSGFHYYIIPLNTDHYINLIIVSADNSVAKGAWGELSARAQKDFLNSLALSGDIPKCE